ncbi:MAG: hypothetical protein HY066_09400 [Betaproteobacteria bacterium]|nr:hypothetical protein [Betaproteobacteria bacterium]
MAINSVVSSTSANLPSVRPQPQADQVRPQEPPKHETPPARPAPARQAAKPPAPPKEAPAEPRPRPVVNTQGETTGRVINTSA